MKTLPVIIVLFSLHSACLYAADPDNINYSSVSDAYEKLQKKPSAKMSHKQGWTIIELLENKNHEIWFFSSKKHNAFPAVIKKTITKKGKGVETKIVTLCEAPKPKCDQLIKQFKSISKEYK